MAVIAESQDHRSKSGVLGHSSLPPSENRGGWGTHFLEVSIRKLSSCNGKGRPPVQFRAEFFNLFNIVNMGLPANVIKGSGFGMISKTANNSRQVQFSLKLIY